MFVRVSFYSAMEKQRFAKTGSGQTSEKLKKTKNVGLLFSAAGTAHCDVLRNPQLHLKALDAEVVVESVK